LTPVQVFLVVVVQKTGAREMKSIIKAGMVLGVCAVLAIAMGGGNKNAAKATPAPVVVQDDDAELIRAMGELFKPSLDASAEAQRADTRAAHPKSTADEWGPIVIPLCVVSCVVGAVVIVALAWIVARSGVLVKMVRALERMAEK
jgi:hypothetical protein